MSGNNPSSRFIPLMTADATFGSTRPIPKLRFGKVVVPLSKAELAALQARADGHIASHGTLHGFVRTLLGEAAGNVR